MAWSRLYDVADCATDPLSSSAGRSSRFKVELIGRTLHRGPAIRLDRDPPEAAVAWLGPAAGADRDYGLHTLLGLARPQG